MTQYIVIVFTSPDGRRRIAVPVAHIAAVANCDLSSTQLASLEPGCLRLLLAGGGHVDVPGDFDAVVKSLGSQVGHGDGDPTPDVRTRDDDWVA